jgi:hypothetical protein
MSNCPTCGRAHAKTDPQRRKFHKMCREIGKHIGETPGKVKEAIKSDFFGMDEYKIGNKLYRAVKPSEQAERDEYSELIEFAYQWAAENCGFVWEREAA